MTTKKLDKIKNEFAIKFAEWIAENHYRLHDVCDSHYWSNEIGTKTTNELLKDYEEEI